MERRFVLIDGNAAKSVNIDGYCLHYHRFLSQGLMHTHRCKHKQDGKPCPKFEPIEYHDSDRW